MMFAPGWRDWRRGFERKFGEYPNTEPGGDYNYRAAWKLGATPEVNPHDGEYHGFSQAQMAPFARPVPLKQNGHPTEWKQKFMDQFGVDPDSNHEETPEMKSFRGKVIDSQLPLIFSSIFGGNQ